MALYNAKSDHEKSFYPGIRVALHNWHVYAAELEESHCHFGCTEASEIHDSTSHREIDELELEDKNLPTTISVPHYHRLVRNYPYIQSIKKNKSANPTTRTWHRSKQIKKAAAATETNNQRQAKGRQHFELTLLIVLIRT